MRHALRECYLGSIVVAVDSGIDGSDGSVARIEGHFLLKLRIKMGGIQLQQAAFLVASAAEMVSVIAYMATRNIQSCLNPRSTVRL